MHTSAPQTPPVLDLRPATDADLGFLFDVYAATRRAEMDATGWPEAMVVAFLRMQFDLQHMQYRQRYPNGSFDVVRCDGAPAGRLYVNRNADGLRLVDITLLPAYRGHGIGTRLLKGLIDEADRQALQISLHVEPQNPARRLYERFGFEVRGEAGLYVCMARPPCGKSSGH